MNAWYKKISVLIVAGIAYLVGQYFRGYWWPNLTWPFPCVETHFGNSIYCSPQYLNTLGWPLITLGEFLAAIGVVLLFANERGLRAWLKFSLWYVPIALLLVLSIYPLQTPLGGIATYTVGVANAGWLYLFGTLGIVLYTRIKKPRAARIS